MPKVFMVQVYAWKWKIVAEKGHDILTDIQVAPHKAEEFVRSWISSFQGWTYEMKPLPKEIK
jgi:hypothetical protein